MFNVWVIYQINTLEHSMLPCFLTLESLNEQILIYLSYIAENDARTSQVDQFAVIPARLRLGTWLTSCHLTGGGHEISDLTNFVSHVYWAIDLRSSLYIINLPHS